MAPQRRSPAQTPHPIHAAHNILFAADQIDSAYRAYGFAMVAANTFFRIDGSCQKTIPFRLINFFIFIDICP
jgi:hypothetical protein